MTDEINDKQKQDDFEPQKVPVDDVVFEGEDGEGNTMDPATKLKQLRDKLKKTEDFSYFSSIYFINFGI